MIEYDLQTGYKYSNRNFIFFLRTNDLHSFEVVS